MLPPCTSFPRRAGAPLGCPWGGTTLASSGCVGGPESSGFKGFFAFRGVPETTRGASKPDTRSPVEPLIGGAFERRPRVEAQETRDEMPIVKVKDNEPFEVALKRFKKQVEKAGILTELRRREYFDKPSIRKKKKAAAARKRALKKLKRMAR